MANIGRHAPSSPVTCTSCPAKPNQANGKLGRQPSSLDADGARLPLRCMLGMHAGADAAGVMATEARAAAVPLRPFTPPHCRSCKAPTNSPPPAALFLLAFVHPRREILARGFHRTDPLPGARAEPFFPPSLSLSFYLDRFFSSMRSRLVFFGSRLHGRHLGDAPVLHGLMPCTNGPCVLPVPLCMVLLFFVGLFYCSAKLKIGRDCPGFSRKMYFSDSAARRR